jgi:hypothetical protein
MDGNFPCPRTEMALAYNPVLNRVLAYSGYTAGMPTLIRETMYQYAYFGDTFMWDPDTRLWKHVITRGFPSFRAQAHMFVDEATGKTYIFGGYTNRDFVSLSLLTSPDRRHSSHRQVPSKHVAKRAFNDLWQLSVDMPGSMLDADALRADEEAPRMGPWLRCFTCGSVGRDWKKCGGTCKGAVMFCSTDCLKDGWADHKQQHNCKKAS